jgi:hypothetical protein
MGAEFFLCVELNHHVGTMRYLKPRNLKRSSVVLYPDGPVRRVIYGVWRRIRFAQTGSQTGWMSQNAFCMKFLYENVTFIVETCVYIA